MYIEVTLVIKIVDSFNNRDVPFTLQKYTETWDMSNYEVKHHSLPVVEKVIGIINDKEVDLSVLLEVEDVGLDPYEGTTLIRSTYEEAFKKGKQLIKDYINGSCVTHF